MRCEIDKLDRRDVERWLLAPNHRDHQAAQERCQCKSASPPSEAQKDRSHARWTPVAHTMFPEMLVEKHSGFSSRDGWLVRWSLERQYLSFSASSRSRLKVGSHVL